MGSNCSHSSELDGSSKLSDDIDKKNIEEYKNIANEIRILLLGTGESGKSTVLKQMQIFQEGGFTELQRKEFRVVILQQVAKNLKVLINESAKTEYTPIQTFDMERANRVTQISESLAFPDLFEKQFTPQLWEDIQVLWADKSIQDTFRCNYKFTLDDSTKYYLDRVPGIALSQNGGFPTNQDIIKSRTKTSSIIEKLYEYRNTSFRIVDVGGQRSERRKWAHCFPDINALIFIVAASEYDQYLREDTSTKRLDESFRVFDDTVNNKFFANKPVIVFLNKLDIFEEKFKQRNLNLYYPEFKGTKSSDALEFLKQKFCEMDKNKDKRQLYFHKVIETDTDLFKPIFESVVLHLINASSQGATGCAKPTKTN